MSKRRTYQSEVRFVQRAGFNEKLELACAQVGGQPQWAYRNNIDLDHVRDVLACRAQPSEKLIEALCLQRLEAYVPYSRRRTQEVTIRRERQASLSFPHEPRTR